MQVIHIDISNKGVIPTVYAKQGDVGRKFSVIFTNSSLPYNVENAIFSAWYGGDSGEGNYTQIGDKPAFVIDGNKVEVEMITQMLSVAGDGVLCLVLSSGEQQIGSWNIPYVCEEVPGFESEGAKKYYTAFSKAVSELPYPDETLSIAGKPADAAATGAALAGKAPAGYGLGGDPVNAPNDNLDAATENGWYSCSSSTIGRPTGLIHIEYGTVLVIRRYGQNVTQLYVSQPNTSVGAPYLLVRNCPSYNAWNPWEWINPPMLAGVEYRTTERYMGKPVYAKLVDCKGMPSGANAAKTVQHNSANVESIVSFGGNMSVGGTKAIALPYYSSDTNLARISVDTLQVRISNGGTDLVGYNDAKVWFKYTKTTA